MNKRQSECGPWTRAIVGATLFLAALGSSYAACPPAPEPVNPASDAPVYIDRDIETCRLFSAQISFDQLTNLYSFYWAESTLADLQWLLDLGLPIAFRDHLFSGRKVQVV